MSSDQEKPSYFQEWYQEHGTKLNKARKKKYSDDPEYRKKVLEQNRDARKRKRDGQLDERRKEKAARKTRVSKSWKTYDMPIEIDGKMVVTKMFTVGAVANVLKCSVQAIRMWERKGVLPETPFRYSKGDRLYTAELIDTFRQILEKQGRLNPNQVRPRPLRSVVRSVKFSTGTTEDVELFRIGELAEAAQRTVVTLEQLESRGYLPKTPFRVSVTGYRLYTENMIKSVQDAFKKRAWEIRGDEEWEQFRDEVQLSWKVQGVIGARILKKKIERKQE